MSGTLKHYAAFVAGVMFILMLLPFGEELSGITREITSEGVYNFDEEAESNPFQLLKNDDQVELNPAQEQAVFSAGLRGANTTWANAGGSEDNDAIYEMAYDSQGNIIICGSIFVDSQFGTILVQTEGLGDILVASLSPNGTWQWVVSAGTATAWDECRGIAMDKDDNVYASGYILGEVNFGPNYTLVPNVYDGYVARVNTTTGQWDWAMSYGGFDIDVGWDLLIDVDYNIYVTGYYQNNTDFGIHSLGSQQPSEDPRFFIAKYNWSLAEWDWAKSSSGSGLSSSFQMAFDQNGDIYVVGYNSGSETWNNTFTSNHASTYAGIIVKYDRDGNFKWGRSYGGTSAFGVYTGIYFNNIVIDSQNRVVVGGNILENGNVGSKTYYTVGGWDVLVLRLLSDGTLDWSAVAGGPSDDRLQALAVMPDDEIVVGGRMINWIEMGNSINISGNSIEHSDAFVGQLDTSGNWLWGNTFGGSASDSTEALLTTSDGFHISAGYFSGTYTFGTAQHYATDEDIFVWKYEWDDDNDSVRDYLDNCRTVANTNQSNWDADGLGDACETDDDNDLLHDALDDCQYGYREWNSSDSNLDHDEDGCHDIEEDLDDDNDGIFDILDSCSKGKLDWISTSEVDLDADGCFDGDEDLDDDNDGIEDDADNCPIIANAGQENYDGDEVGDLCDNDDDGDGITDQYDDCGLNETNWTSDGATDNDGDGCNDELEDLDDDNDGMLDLDDDCPTGLSNWNVSAVTDHDWDGCKNTVEDNDDDNDEVINAFDLCPLGTTNWSNDGLVDNDLDGCHDSSEDLDDDNDGFPDNEDDCPTNAGGSYLGQLKGCADDDEDGWGDYSDAFPFDGSQWDDGDEDTFGDNPFGTRPDACPLVSGNSTADRFGCTDTDGDGYSDPDADWTVADGADALVNNFDQQSDSDNDGFGDKKYSDLGGLALDFDDCPQTWGNSSIDRVGCLDGDGDGYSNPSEGWSKSDGADHFEYETTQWRDSDGDGYGDNWGNATWNQTRLEFEIGVFITDAYKPDLCPDSAYKFAQSYGCSPANMPIFSIEDDGHNSTTGNNDQLGGGSDAGISTTVIIMIFVSALLVIGLAAAIMLLLRAPEKKAKVKTRPSVDAEVAAAEKSHVEIPEDGTSDTEASDISAGSVEDENQNAVDEATTVDSWEKLPSGGEYLDPDDSGTVWYKTAEGTHWYRNADESWSLYK